MVTQNTGILALLLCCASLPALAAQAEERPDGQSVDSQTVKLLAVQTVYVDELRGADGREQIRDMLIGSLQRSGLFLLTEDQQHADAYLRGSAEDLIFVEVYRQRDGIQVRGSASSSERESAESDFRSSSFGIGDTDDSYRRERKHEAMAAVRLVLANGEVVWSTTQESSGAKYRGPAADVAEKVTKELALAFERARRLARSKQGESAVLDTKPAER
jgi:hypothetical protein